MWTRIAEEIRRAGPRKVAVLAIAAAVAVALAYGVNSTNDAANGRTLPRTSHVVRLSAGVAQLSVGAAPAASRRR